MQDVLNRSKQIPVRSAVKSYFKLHTGTLTVKILLKEKRIIDTMGHRLHNLQITTEHRARTF